MKWYILIWYLIFDVFYCMVSKRMSVVIQITPNPMIVKGIGRRIKWKVNYFNRDVQWVRSGQITWLWYQVFHTFRKPLMVQTERHYDGNGLSRKFELLTNFISTQLGDYSCDEIVNKCTKFCDIDFETIDNCLRQVVCLTQRPNFENCSWWNWTIE